MGNMGDVSERHGAGVQRTDLPTAVSNMLEEARMLLPGSQTLFGFQLIVVFEQSFDERLSTVEQYLHLAAMLLTAVAIALLMAPAAYHRQVEPQSVSRRFLGMASRQLTWGALPLAISLCFEVYLVTTLIATNQTVALGLTGLLLAVFGVLWYVLPRRATPPADAPGAHEVKPQ